MKPLGSITKPEPSEVTCRGALPLGPRKSLNRSSSGEPGGRSGICCAGALRVWEVEILTTVGNSLAARSAKESGAPRAKADSNGQANSARTAHSNAAKRIRPTLKAWNRAQHNHPFPEQIGRKRPSAPKKA